MRQARHREGQRSVALLRLMHLDWAGEINELHEAGRAPARVIIPVTILFITFLTFNRREALDRYAYRARRIFPSHARVAWSLSFSRA